MADERDQSDRTSGTAREAGHGGRTRRDDADPAAADRREGDRTRDHPSEEQERPDAPPLEPHEERKADEEEQLNVGVTYEVIRRTGQDELRRPSRALAWSGLAAGLSMGFSMLVPALLESHLPDTTWRPLVSKLGYTIGFLVVILGNQHLFTENTLTAVIPLLARKLPDTLRNTVRLWVVVLVANLVGAFVFALAIGTDNLFPAETVRAFEGAGTSALEGSGLRTFLLAIFAGWLIALMVWMRPAAQGFDVIVIILITYVVGIGEFPHIIAGAAEVFYAATEGLVSWREIATGYLLPTLAGNTLGGTALVAGLAHAQVVAGGGKRD